MHALLLPPLLLCRLPNELASYQHKVLKIDDHMGLSLAGLTADARTLAKHMRTECMNHKYVYGSNMQARRLAVDLADMHQVRIHGSQFGL